MIKNLPQLVKILNYYDYRNPYILCDYKGNDWMSHVKYDYYKTNKIKLGNKLNLVSCRQNQEYKINKGDFIKILDGQIIIDDNKRIINYFFYDYNYFRGICRGYDLYNTFLHYSNSNSNSK